MQTASTIGHAAIEGALAVEIMRMNPTNHRENVSEKETESEKESATFETATAESDHPTKIEIGILTVEIATRIDPATVTARLNMNDTATVVETERKIDRL